MQADRTRARRHVACAILAMAALTGDPTAQRPEAVILSIVGTNDLHGSIVPRDGRGGLDVFGGYVANLRAARARDGGAVLLIDAGDMFQGTLESNMSEGASVVTAYNALRYTAAAIGNHEFDFGPVGPSATPQRPADDGRGALKARAAAATFPFLAANLLDGTTGQPVTWPNVRPAVLVERAGVTVGIIGVTTRETLSATIAANTHGLRIAPLTPTIQAHATRLRSQGASVVIVAAHAGGRCSDLRNPLNLSSCQAAAEIFEVARALPPGLVDAIVAGHSHAGIAHLVAGTPIIESFSNGRSFGRVDLTVQRGRVAEKRVFAPRDVCAQVAEATERCDPAVAGRARWVPARYENANVLPDADVARLLAPVIAEVRSLKSRRLGVDVETPIVRVPDSGESPLGNLFTDLFLASHPRAEFAMNNTRGGLRADLPAGPLTYGSLFEVFPFDNRLIELTLTGRQLRRVLAAQSRASDRVGIAGLRIEVGCSSGRPRVSMIRPSGTPVRDDQRIRVVTTDFIATGGDSILASVMPRGGFALDGELPLARDAVAEQLQRRGGRLRAVDLVDPAKPRWTGTGCR